MLQPLLGAAVLDSGATQTKALHFSCSVCSETFGIGNTRIALWLPIQRRHALYEFPVLASIAGMCKRRGLLPPPLLLA